MGMEYAQTLAKTKSQAELQAMLSRLQESQSTSEHGKGNFQSQISDVRWALKNLGQAKPAAAAPKPAAPKVVTPIGRIVDTPVAPASPKPPVIPDLSHDNVFNNDWSAQPPVGATKPGGDAAPQPVAQPTLTDAANRVDATAPAGTPPAQLDPQATPATPAKRKKYGVASTILTGASGLANLGSTGTRMLLG